MAQPAQTFTRAWHDETSVDPNRLQDRFELLELRRDDGIQTFHAREVSTARPVQVHFFDASVPRDLALLSRLERLPDAERRRVIDHGVSGGRPYIVTDRLAGFASLREWLESQAGSPSLDQQFFELFDSEVPERQEQPEVILSDEEGAHTEGSHAGSALGAMALGIVVAIAFLVLVIAAFAFHPK
jgi:hypothetical protein